MKQIPNPVIEREILDELSDKYLTGSHRDRSKGIHLTNLIYCLTRSYHELTDPLPPSDMEVMLFCIGFGLEAVLLKDGSRLPEGEKDGVFYSPDFITLKSGLAELKTTRMSKNKTDLPETWMEQMMGYCYGEGYTVIDLAVLHLLGDYKPPFPAIRGWQLEFTTEELKENWARLLQRKDILVDALVSGDPPTVGKYCKDWECPVAGGKWNCRYDFRCKVTQHVVDEFDNPMDATDLAGSSQ